MSMSPRRGATAAGDLDPQDGDDPMGAFWGNLFRAEIARDLRSKHEDTFAQRLPECLTATEQGGCYGRAVMRLVARATVKL